MITHLVNGDSVHIGVVHKPDDLIGEQFSIVLRGEVRLCRLTGVELEGLAYALPQNIQCWISFHDLGHGLLNQRFHTRNPVAKRTAIQSTSTALL